MGKDLDYQLTFLNIFPQNALNNNQLQDYYEILTNFDFLAEKIKHLGVQELIKDYDLVSDPEVKHLEYDSERLKALKLVQKALQLSAHILAKDKTQLPCQLWGRLQCFEIPDIQILLEQAEQNSETTWLCPVGASLHRPSEGLLRTLSDRWVRAVAVTPDSKQVISGSDDKTLKVWNLKTGNMERTLSGHTESVNAVAVTPDSKQVISGSDDKTLKVWNLKTGNIERTLSGHTESVNAVAITPDSKQVISGSDDKTLKVWNLETGNIERTLSGHTESVNAVAVTPDGKRVISVSVELDCKFIKLKKEIIIWNLETGEGQILSFESVRRNIFDSNLQSSAVAVTSKGEKVVISGSYGNTLKAWNLEEPGKNQGIPIGFTTKNLKAVAITLDRWVISASSNTLKAWNLKTGEELFTLKTHSHLVNAVAVTPDGKQLISSSSLDSTLKVWDLKDAAVTNNQIDYFNDSSNDSSLKAIAFSFNGKWLIKAFSDTSLNALNLELEKETVISSSFSNTFAVTADSKQVISGLSNGKLKVFNLETGKKISLGSYFNDYQDFLTSATDQINSFTFGQTSAQLIRDYNLDPNKERLYPGLDFNYLLCIISIILLLIWPVSLLLVVFRRVNLIEHLYNIPDFFYGSFKPSYFGYYIYMASIINLLIVIPVTFLFVAIIQSYLFDVLIYFYYHCQWFFWRAIRFDDFIVFIYTWIGGYIGAYIAICLAILWNPKPENHHHTIRHTTLAVTSNGEWVISASTWGSLRIWDLKKKKKLFTLTGHTKPIKTIASIPFSPWVISGSSDRTLKVWNLQTRNELFTLEGHSDSINAVAVTPDGSLVISGSSDRTLKVWNLQTRNELFTLEGHSDSINAVAVTPDGSLVISGSSDKTLKVWDLSSGNVIASFTGDSKIWCCAVAPDGIKIGAEPDADGIKIGAGEESGRIHLLRLKQT